MKIAIIGTGNTATVLGKKIHQEGHTIEQVIGRDISNAKQLAKQLDAHADDQFDNINKDVELIIIAVTDTAIPEIASRVNVGRKLIVHTAGSVSKDILKESSTNYGVLYPLQSLRKEIEVLPSIPFMVDGNTEESKTLVHDFASSISDIVVDADDEKRLKTHVAAVIASNFTNYLYVLTEDYCTAEGIEFRSLVPLITEISSRLKQFSPLDIQTGPASRNDQGIIDKHLSLLKSYPEQEHFYQIFSESIKRRFRR